MVTSSLRTRASGALTPVLLLVLLGAFFLLPAHTHAASDQPTDCTPAPVTTIPNIPQPKGLVVNPEANLVYAAAYSANALVVIDGATQTVQRTVSGIDSPNQIAYDSVRSRLYITNRNTARLTVLDANTYTTLAQVPVGQLPYGVAVNSLTQRVYVANFGSNTVQVIDAATLTVVATASLPNHPTFVTVDVTRNMAYVVSNESGNIYAIGPDNQVSYLLNAGDSGIVGLAVDEALDRLFISSVGSKVYVYDLETHLRVAEIALPGTPKALATNPGDHQVFASPWGNARDLYQVDGAGLTYRGALPAGWGDGDGLAVNSLTGLVYLANRYDNTITVARDTCATPPPPPGQTRMAGMIRVAADTFVDLPDGRTKARGHVMLGDYFSLIEPDAEVFFNQAQLSGTATLAIGAGQNPTPLFTGSFSANVSSGRVTVGTTQPRLNLVAGFTFTSPPAWGEINLAGGSASGAAPLRIDKGDLRGDGILQFTLRGTTSGPQPTANASFPHLTYASGTQLGMQQVNGQLVSGRLALATTLQVRIPGSTRDVTVSLTMLPDGTVSATIPSLVLNIADAPLTLNNVTLDNSGLHVDSGSLQLPAVLNNARLTVTGISVTGAGLQVGQLSAITPVHLGAGGFPLHIDSISLVAGGAAGLRIQFDCTVEIAGTNGLGGSAAGAVWLELGRVGGSLHSLHVTAAGLTIGASQMTVDGDALRAQTVTLSMPDPFGSGLLTANNLSLSPRDISISGGTLALPEIRVGDLHLGGLRGGFEQVNHSLRIVTGGSLNLPNLGPAGSCSGLAVTVIMRVQMAGDGASKVLLEIAPQAPPAHVDARLARAARQIPHGTNSPDGLVFEEISLNLACRIPIGSTGFSMMEAGGSITYDPVTNAVTIGLHTRIESDLRLGPMTVVSAQANASVVTQPFEMGVAGTVNVFIFPVAGAEARLTANRFTATLWMEIIVARGRVSVQAWSDNGFHFTGSGTFEVGIPRGAIWNIGITIPPRAWILGDTQVDVGEFTNGAWGFRGRVCFLGWCNGLFVDTHGRMTFGNVDAYRLIPGSQLAAVRQAWLAQRGSASPAAWFDAGDGIWVTPDADIVVTVVVTDTTDVLFGVKRSGAAPALTLVDPNGNAITPASLPPNVVYNTQEVTGTLATVQTQEMYGVNQAQHGTWQAVLHNVPPDPLAYDLVVLGAQPSPSLADVTATATGNRQADISWRLMATTPLTVSVYANSGPMTVTLVMTDTQPPHSVERPNFSGPALLVDPSPVHNGSLQTFHADLSALPSGLYHFWVEANDQQNAPLRVYAPQAVQVTQPWPSTWNAQLTAVPGYRQLALSWSALANPDVDTYRVHVSAPVYTTTQVIDVGLNLVHTLDSLETGQPYVVWVEAVDREGGRSVQSQPLTRTPTAAPFSLALVSAPPTLVAGETTTVTLRVQTTLPSYPEGVGFGPGAGVPAGLQMRFVPAVITPTIAGRLIAVGLYAPPTLAPGAYNLPVVAVGGGTTRLLTLPLTVQAPDFALSANAGDGRLLAGRGLAVVVHVLPVRGQPGPVDLSLDNVPAGLLYEFAQTAVLPGGQTRLILRDSPLLPAGPHTLRLVGTAAGQTHTIQINITVVSPAYFQFVPALRRAR